MSTSELETARTDIDPTETFEWKDSLQAVMEARGARRAGYLLSRLVDLAHDQGLRVPYPLNTPYVNTIPVSEEPVYPGDRKIERRIKSILRWNAMAMVVRANKNSPGIGGHISTYASCATLFEVGFQHFFRARTDTFSGDQVYFQGHASPGIYARAYLEGRIDETHLVNFRREMAKGGGLSSYPHPWSMPDFWQFPTVSMGLTSLQAIYQARFNEYLKDRGLLDTSGSKVWAFLGDGEMDEPESLGAITLASREKLSNLIFVVNCNLQRLDGPVRGNGQIIQELEAAFRGAGWNVIKVLWGSDYDPLFEQDPDGHLLQRMEQVVDGEYQKYVVEGGAYVREHFFGKDPFLRELVAGHTDEQLAKLRRGGHDPRKVHAAYRAAVDHTEGPTVILAMTIKGYGLGEAGEGRNITHQQKKLNEEELHKFRDRFDIPIPDKDLAHAPFYRPDENSEEIRYLKERRAALGGFVPRRVVSVPKLETPKIEAFQEFLTGSNGMEVSTTMAYVQMLARLLKDKSIGKLLVPIVPDEARTFGMEALFRSAGIYAHQGQLYEPVDSHLLLYYREAQNGQILEEGITEAGAMSSFLAAGTAYATHGQPTIPLYIFYSMFGFQRIGDLVWAAGDLRARGFLLGATAGRTTLAGEGLQHQDGHSHVLASTIPSVRAYDPAFAYEIAIVLQDGLHRMVEKNEDWVYYVTLGNETYTMPAMPEGAREGILKGLYRLLPEPESLAKGKAKAKPERRIKLLGSGAILNEVVRARDVLAEKYGVAAEVYSVPSYGELRREAMAVERHNRLHPLEKPKVAHVTQLLDADDRPIVAASDYVRTLPDMIRPYLRASMTTLGTDGYGRSEDRVNLRRFFEVNTAHVVYAALVELAKGGAFSAKDLAKAIVDLGIDADAGDPWTR